MVEVAFTLIPFLALSFAIVDFSFPIFLRSTFVHAVREGARYGITYNTLTGMSHKESIKEIVFRQAGGFLSRTTHADNVQVRYFNPVTFVEESGAGSNARGNIVEVSIEDFEWGYMLRLWRTGNPLLITARSSDRLESPPNGVALPPP
jgi:hypothetical protein